VKEYKDQTDDNSKKVF